MFLTLSQAIFDTREHFDCNIASFTSIVINCIAGLNVSLKNYSCELFNLMGTVGKVELISTFTTAVCESCNVSDKYTWDNAGDHKQLSMDQTLSKDNRSD